ncbi:MAG TPA: hypothetical protein VFL79_12745, partial [Terriglobia bacterium]|nr:hypothetical protein [Terriglobia bacterium]
MHSRKVAAVLLTLVLSLALCALTACGGGGSSSAPASSDPPPAPAPPPNPTPSSTPSTTSQYGQWSTLPYTMPINPIHAALLHTGKVLIVAGSGNDPNNAFPINTNPDYEAAVWDPQAGKITTQRVTWDMFCNGMSLMQDGRVLMNGGTASYGSLAVVGGASDTPFTGLPNSAIFDPATE